jgi:phosphosulfolactate phosphohydrolase-like enzyme
LRRPTPEQVMIGDSEGHRMRGSDYAHSPSMVTKRDWG